MSSRRVRRAMMMESFGWGAFATGDVTVSAEHENATRTNRTDSDYTMCGNRPTSDSDAGHHARGLKGTWNMWFGDARARFHFPTKRQRYVISQTHTDHFGPAAGQ